MTAWRKPPGFAITAATRSAGASVCVGLADQMTRETSTGASSAPFSFAVLAVAAKYRMASVGQFMMFETAFTLLQFAEVSPLIALAHRQPGRGGKGEFAPIKSPLSG